METANHNPTLREYLKIVFRHKLVIIVVVVATTAMVWIGLSLKTPVYTAKVTMLISAEKQVESPYYRELDSKPKAVLTQSQIVRSGPVIAEAVKALKLDERPLDYEKGFASFLKKRLIDFRVAKIRERLDGLPPEIKKEQMLRIAANNLKANIKTEPIRETNLFTINVSDYNPFLAATVANTVSRSYVMFDLRQQLAEMQLKYGSKHPTVLQLSDSITDMRDKLSGEPLEDIEAIGPASVKIIEQAGIPTGADGPSGKMVMLLAFFSSTVVGVALAFIIEYLDQTFRSPQEIEAHLNMPYLGSLPKKEAQIPRLVTAERLNMAMKEKNLKSLLFVSALPDEGTTDCIFKFASFLSNNAGYKVLIMDTNLRHERAHKFFKNTSGPALGDVLDNKSTFASAVRNIGPNLYFLPAGKAQARPASSLSSGALEALIRQAGKEYDRVLIDCNPLSEYTDGQLLCSMPDGLVLVIREGKAPRHAVKAALAPLEQRNAYFLGAVMSMRTFPVPSKIYHSF